MIIVMKLILWRKVAVEPVLERESLKNLGVYLKPVILTQFKLCNVHLWNGRNNYNYNRIWCV